MLLMLALLSCTGGPDVLPMHTPPADDGDRIATVAAPPPPREEAVRTVALPVGEATVTDCSEGGFERKRSAGRPGTPRSMPRPKPRPARRPDGHKGGGLPPSATRGSGEGMASGGLAGGGGAPAADAPAPPPPQPAPAAAPEAEPSPRANEELQMKVGQNRAKEKAKKDRAASFDDDANGLDAIGTRSEVAQQPSLDWGATIYLSNDDSMSLASAQRVLYAVTRGARLSPGQIRPHELLNYFSFDTAPVPDGRLFSVLGGAEQDGDTLTVSLAVRGALPERQPLDLTVVIDRSGSMSAEGRMEYLKRGLHTMTGELQRGDRVDVVLFDNSVCTPLRDWVVGRDDPELLTRTIDSLRPRGSTDLDAGLKEAYALQTGREAADVHHRNRRVLLITDAQLNTGNVNQAVVSQVGAAFEDHGIRLTGVGVGRDFNDKMLDMLTEKGKGAYVYLGSEAVVDRIFGPGFRSLTETIAHDVQFSLDLPDSLAMERFYGEEASTDAADVQPIHYYAGTSQLFLQDLRLRDGAPVRTDPVVLNIAYRDARTGEPGSQALRTTVGALLDGEQRNLHKGQALMAWTDMLSERALGGASCGDALERYAGAASTVDDDAEIGFLNRLTSEMCGVRLPEAGVAGVAYKVKVDSDIPIAEVGLDCGGRAMSERLAGGDTVARFAQAQPGACTLTLQGNVAMTADVEVPETGGDVRCLIRGGRLSCG